MAREAPTAVLQAAFSRLVEAHTEAPKPAGGAAAFNATRGFLGRRQGYYFGTGPQGIGCVSQDGHAAALLSHRPAGLQVSARPQLLSALRRYYLDARQAQPPVEAEKATAEKEETLEVRMPQPVDAEALLREAEEQAGDQVRLYLAVCLALLLSHLITGAGCCGLLTH